MNTWFESEGPAVYTHARFVRTVGRTDWNPQGICQSRIEIELPIPLHNNWYQDTQLVDWWGQWCINEVGTDWVPLELVGY